MASLYDIDFEDYADKITPWLLRDADFIIVDGDVGYGDTIEQDVQLILKAGKGNFYQSPRIGMSIDKKLNSPVNKTALRTEIIEALSEDNIRADKIDIITYDDVKDTNDSELISVVKKNKFVLSITASR